jgi:transcriptional regulator with XRE-family HTH domain
MYNRIKRRRACLVVTFGQRLKQLRVERRMTLAELAEALGTDVWTVANWERDRGEIDFGVVHKVAQFFGVSHKYMDGKSASPTSGHVTLEEIADFRKSLADYRKNLENGTPVTYQGVELNSKALDFIESRINEAERHLRNTE